MNKLHADDIPAVGCKIISLAVRPIPHTLRAAMLVMPVSIFEKCRSKSPEPIITSPYLIKLTRSASVVCLYTPASKPHEELATLVKIASLDRALVKIC